ncbi:MAG TPA: tRNA pseudouridine(55) synthase TruB, partial [Ilumatobacteraceae bacterium]
MARRRPPTQHGLAVVDKPAGVTSHDVVGMVRKRFDERQVGHAGTLDPDATGILLVGVGKATRLLRFLTALGKTYTADVVLGTSTSTLDAAGEVTATYDMSSVTVEMARSMAAEHLTGPIMQVPPMVSALHVDGRRLHELAREGIVVEREPRPVTVHSFHVAGTDDPTVLRIEVRCSAGTYIRSLADDLGRLLGGGAHLTNLRRTAVGSFGELEARTPDQCELLAPVDALRDYPRVTV